MLIKEAPRGARVEAEFECAVRFLTGAPLAQHMRSANAQLRVQFITDHDAWNLARNENAPV